MTKKLEAGRGGSHATRLGLSLLPPRMQILPLCLGALSSLSRGVVGLNGSKLIKVERSKVKMMVIWC